MKLNSLAQASSTYLKQHAQNPVNWFSWGDEALQKARLEDKPIFLSIGYASCHWCHVMAHESFEDQEIAAQLNQHFVPIKVDRQERPDLDQFYMKAVMAMTGSGGWPMSVFLTPDLKPFFGGTYFPPRSAYGRPGFLDLLLKIVEFWRDQRNDLQEQSQKLLEYLQQKPKAAEGSFSLEHFKNTAKQAQDRLLLKYDAEYGGFGAAPKFPSPHQYLFLLHQAYLDPSSANEIVSRVDFSLKKMCSGALFDWVDGGFARYSVDRFWHIPHFEKMLYDQAGMIHLYASFYQITQDSFYEAVVKKSIQYVLEQLDSSQGFISAEDADSEHEEGLFYVWEWVELKQVLSEEEFNWIVQHFTISTEGNWESGRNALILKDIFDFEKQDFYHPAFQKLKEIRAKRVRPQKDELVVAAWNFWMISALVKASLALDRADYLEKAEHTAEKILAQFFQNGKLCRCNPDSFSEGFLDDYAFAVQALLDLYEATQKPSWREWAERLHAVLIEHFWQEPSFSYRAKAHSDQISIQLEGEDGAMPSAYSVELSNLLRMALLKSDGALLEKFDQLLQTEGAALSQYPEAFSYTLIALQLRLNSMELWKGSGENFEYQAKTLLKKFIPVKYWVLGQSGQEIRLDRCDMKQCFESLSEKQIPAFLESRDVLKAFKKL